MALVPISANELVSSVRAKMNALIDEANAIGEAVEATEADAAQTSADRIAVAADRVLTEAARDAAFGDANIYADTAAGLADTTEGDQFAVLAGDESVRYQHDAGPVATEVARYPLSSMLRLKQTIGRAVAPVTGTAASARTIVFADAVTLAAARISAFRIYSSGAGTIWLNRFLKTGDDFVTVGPSLFIDVAAGVNTFDAATFGFWPVYENERIGISTPGSTLVYTGATSDGTGFYDAGALAWAFTDSTVATNLRCQVGFDLLAGDLSQVEDRESRVEASGVVGEIQRIGRVGAPIDGLSATTSTYALGDVILNDGVLSEVSVWCRTAGNLIVRRFTRAGNDWTRVGADLTLPMSVGLNTWTNETLPEFEVLAGEYIGFYTAGVIAYTLTGAFAGNRGWYSSGGPNATSFTQGAGVGTRLEIAFKVASGPVPKLQAQVANLGTTLRYDDSIADASVTQAGFDLTCSLAFDRNGVLTSLSDDQTISAATSTNKRYDIWYYDTDAGTFGVASGTERAVDPTVGIPALTINQLPLFLIRSTASAAVVTPLWNVYDYEVRSLAAQMEAERRRARRLLPNTLAKIRRGDPLRILGFGDSITALTGGAAVGSTSALNGAARDAAAASSGTYQYLRGGYGSDIVDALPLYTAVQLGHADDGAGAIHTRVGWNWELVAALERAGAHVLGTNLWYDNLGINGYATANAISGGSPTTWLNTGTGSGADLVVINLGMNELGNASTGTNMEFIIDEFLDAGIEVLVLGPPVVEQRTSRLIRSAAYTKGVAHLSLTPLYDSRYVQAMGISSADLYAANKSNHPGIEEFRSIGRELVKTLLG